MVTDCRSELYALNAALPAAGPRGAEMVVISPQLPILLADLKTKLKLDFDILHDAGNRAAETFGSGMQLPPDLIEVYKKIGVDPAPNPARRRTPKHSPVTSPSLPCLILVSTVCRPAIVLSATITPHERDWRSRGG